DLRQVLGRPATLQEARQYALNQEATLQAMGYSQPNTAEAVMAKEKGSSGSGRAVENKGTASHSAPGAGPKATSKPPEGLSAEAYADQGYKFLEAKDYAKAIEAYEKVLAVDASSRRGYQGLALAYEGQKQWQPAIENRQKLMALRPDDADTLLTLASDYFFNHEYQRSVATAKQYIALRPLDPIGLLQLAV